MHSCLKHHVNRIKLHPRMATRLVRTSPGQTRVLDGELRRTDESYLTTHKEALPGHAIHWRAFFLITGVCGASAKARLSP
jgi:hypothetical protein